MAVAYTLRSTAKYVHMLRNPFFRYDMWAWLHKACLFVNKNKRTFKFVSSSNYFHKARKKSWFKNIEKHCINDLLTLRIHGWLTRFPAVWTNEGATTRFPAVWTNERATTVILQINNCIFGTVWRPTLGRLLRNGEERIWAFPSTTVSSWLEQKLKLKLKLDPKQCQWRTNADLLWTLTMAMSPTRIQLVKLSSRSLAEHGPSTRCLTPASLILRDQN